MENDQQYHLVDSGLGLKLERFGPYLLSRPSAQAVWRPHLPKEAWQAADATFSRQEGQGWKGREALPESWKVAIEGISFKVSVTDFGHLGLFPEQRPFWCWIEQQVRAASERRGAPPRLLNLFAYSGGVTLAAAKGGGEVCHLDASKGMVAWAKENSRLNNLEKAPIRWITDDVRKFVRRELTRGRSYDAIVLDPPTFGRGAKGELFKIEEHLPDLLDQCRQLLSDNPLFFLLSCHTPGYSPTGLNHLLDQCLVGLEGDIDVGEMFLEGDLLPLPSGTYARWRSR